MRKSLVNIYVETEQKKFLVRFAKKSKTSFAEQVRRALAEYISRQQSK